jgi:hypothetical protein
MDILVIDWRSWELRKWGAPTLGYPTCGLGVGGGGGAQILYRNDMFTDM